MLYRFLEISEYYGNLDGLLRAKFAYSNVNFRHTVTPSKSLPWNFTPLSMTEKQVQDMVTQGLADGKAALTQTHSTDDLVQYFALVRSRDESVKDMSFAEFMAKKEEMPAPNMENLKFLQS